METIAKTELSRKWSKFWNSKGSLIITKLGISFRIKRLTSGTSQKFIHTFINRRASNNSRSSVTCTWTCEGWYMMNELNDRSKSSFLRKFCCLDEIPRKVAQNRDFETNVTCRKKIDVPHENNLKKTLETNPTFHCFLPDLAHYIPFAVSKQTCAEKSAFAADEHPYNDTKAAKSHPPLSNLRIHSLLLSML